MITLPTVVTDSSTLTINEAAETTGWSPRMLRYIEEMGLVVPSRSGAGYRLYGAGDLQRLRTLRDLLDGHGVGLAEIGFARRLVNDTNLATAVHGWLESTPIRPEEIAADDWLAWEQQKHMALLDRAEASST